MDDDVQISNEAARRDLDRATAKREAMQEALAATQEHGDELETAIAKAELGIVRRKKRLEELAEHQRLLDYKGNVMAYEAKTVQRMPTWWFALVCLHEIVSFYAYGKGSWAFVALNQWMFLAHLRRLYVKSSGAPALISLGVVPLSMVFI